MCVCVYILVCTKGYGEECIYSDLYGGGLCVNVLYTQLFVGVYMSLWRGECVYLYRVMYVYIYIIVYTSI